MDGGKFFGAFRACCGITDAVVLNHAPIGCNWGAGMFKTTSDQLDLRHACTVMHEREIVFGGETSLREALKRADDLYHSPLIIIAVGDVPTIIGDDIESITSSAGLSKPVVWVDAAGFKGSMQKGYEEALIRLAPLMKEGPTVERSVNIIGFYPDDFKVDSDIKEIKRMLTGEGIRINSIISNCTFDQFIKAPRAELNVVLGQGIELSKWMQKSFGLPYVVCNYPYGLESSRKLISTVCDHLGLGYDKEMDLSPFKKVFLWLNELVGTPVSIIGNSRAIPMADFLHHELGLEIEA
ncbi:MAG: nitrogenase component 1, partial [Methanothrix sp.]